MTDNINNERVKRAYVNWLREAKGFAESTITVIERATSLWEEFSGHEGFAKFSQSKAIKFKEWLAERTKRKGANGNVTNYHILRHLKTFFHWLATQPGFKSKIDLSSVSLLSLDRKKVREIISPKFQEFPSLEHVRKLVSSIEIYSEIDQRDRALISFLLLSGMRDKAVASLPLGCFDREKLEIRQLPQSGVDTKFSKSMVTYLWKFDEELLKHVLDWSLYLEEVKLFGAADPMFPRNKVERSPETLVFCSSETEPKFWKGAGSIRRILELRSKEAGLRYYKPHSFRHAASHIAQSYCRTPEQMRAVSQNLGHENIGTTITTYGKLDQFRLADVIRSMDFSPDAGSEITETEARVLENMLRKARKRI